MPTRLCVRGAILVLAVGLGGCLVHTRHLDDAGPVFEKARAAAVRAQGQPGRPRRIHVLVFEPEERELTEVEVPMWLWRKLGKKADFGDDAVAQALKPDALDSAGRGLLLEVAEADGDQVLVWLH